MLTTDQFALWKFKTIEGVLENVTSCDFTSTRIQRGFEVYMITYDLKTSTCKIDNVSKLETQPFTCTFKELVNKLKELGIYHERTTMRHSSSYIPYTGTLE